WRLGLVFLSLSMNPLQNSEVIIDYKLTITDRVSEGKETVHRGNHSQNVEHALPQQYNHLFTEGKFETTPVSHSGA
ncbi:unnamed protein product, partial [Brassica oleracea]